MNVSTSSGAIVAIADMNSLEAEVDVNESNVAQLRPASRRISVQAIPNHPYEGRLRQVIPTADRTKATVTVKVTILDKDKYLKPEIKVNVTFLQPQKAADKKNALPVRIVTIPQRHDHHPRWQAGGFARLTATRFVNFRLPPGLTCTEESSSPAGWQDRRHWSAFFGEAERRGYGKSKGVTYSEDTLRARGCPAGYIKLKC